MSGGRRLSVLLALGACAAATTPLAAEPMFLSRQYNRCTSCHYSATGGGLLTPYGRSLSRQELSTWGRSPAGTAPTTPGHGEEAFLYGALGDSLGPLDLGIDTRPSHLSLDSSGYTSSMDILMTADIWAAVRSHGFTLYGDFGRQPLLPPPAGPGTRYDSYEWWASYESEKGLGIRAGRFMPAYGINFADHTSFNRGGFNRSGLGFDFLDQLLGVELSHSGEHHLLQVALAPGRAESMLHGNQDGLQAFTTTGRFQFDTSSSSALVVSGQYRASSNVQPSSAGGGLAFGFSPLRRLTVWTEADVKQQSGNSGAPLYVLVNETSFEVYRGIWLKFSPQLQTEYGNTSGGAWRLAFAALFFPRTHWHAEIDYYRDEGRTTSIVTKTLLLQLHLYL